MATDFLNDARREIEGWTEDFYGELKAFYQGNAKAEQNLMEQTTQPFWQSLCLSGKRLQQREPDGGYGDAGTGAAGGLRWPEKGRL